VLQGGAFKQWVACHAAGLHQQPVNSKEVSHELGSKGLMISCCAQNTQKDQIRQIWIVVENVVTTLQKC